MSEMPPPTIAGSSAGAGAVRLSAEQRDLVLSVLPAGATLRRASFFPNYNLPCPIHVEAETAHGMVGVVVRTCRHGDAHLEAELLETLSRFGAPVPRPLAVGTEGDVRFSVLELLPGTTIQSAAEADRDTPRPLVELVVDAAQLMATWTTAVAASPVGVRLPRRTLETRVAHLDESSPTWLSDPQISAAYRRLAAAIVAEASIQPSFSNGDLQAGNLLTDGSLLTGIVDFECAAFDDPLIGMAKYPIYDLLPLSRQGIVDAFLTRIGATKRDFALRVGVAGMETLVREVPIGTKDPVEMAYSDRLRGLVTDAAGAV